MVGAFAGRQGVGMPGIQAEVMPPVLQRKAPARRHNTGAKPHIVAVDKRTGIAPAVHHAEIYRVGGGRRRAALLVERCPPRVDQLTALVRISRRKQHLQRRRIEGRVSHIPARIGKGQAQRFDFQMQARGAERRQPGEIETLQDIQRQQGSQPLPIGRTFPDAHTAIFNADRPLPGAVVGSQVLDAQAAAGFLHHASNRRGDLTLVESRLTAFGNLLQAAPQAGIAKNFARLRAAPLDRQFLPPWRRAQLALGAALPEMRRNRRHRKPLLRQADGGRQDGAERQAAMSFDQIAPAGAGARHGNRIRVVGGQFIPKALVFQALQRQSRRGAPGAVQSAHLARGSLVIQGETVAAQPG